MYDQSKRNCAQINEILRTMRAEKGYTQEQVAAFLQVDRTTYAKYENGRMPEVDVIMLLCQLYQITPNELLMDFRPVRPDGSLGAEGYLCRAKGEDMYTEREKDLIRQFRICRRKERVEFITAYYIWEEEQGIANLPPSGAGKN